MSTVGAWEPEAAPDEQEICAASAWSKGRLVYQRVQEVIAAVGRTETTEPAAKGGTLS